MKNRELCTVISFASLIGGAAGCLISKAILEKSHKQEFEQVNKEVSETIDKAKKEIENINEQVDKAVRFVYDNEAKNAFEKRLRGVNIEEIADNVCRSELHRIEDFVIKARIRAEYESQIHRVMQEELKDYFKTGIQKIVDVDIDSEFIRRTAKQYIRDEIREMLEEQIERAVDGANVDDKIDRAIDGIDIDDKIDRAIDDLDIDEMVEDYFDSHKFKAVKDAIEKIIREVNDN